ncbi:SAM-dependent methyltransferase [Nocardia carnea]|uniref:SAM-dependent methyltransferase n=1 Tax=Nocardia carnea TaxID=37328 RepID=UPI0024570AD6|nr:SAM-dependent methyltransferase [Nocardia carnea]
MTDSMPRELDTSTPTSARMYHAMLTGETFYDTDRRFMERLYDTIPIFPVWARHNRGFLARAVDYMVGNGIEQFLDVGSGLPTGGSTHEIAHAIDPDVRVVYTDIDTDAIVRAREQLVDQGVTATAAMVPGDLREPHQILHHPETVRLLDFTQPVGVLLVSILPFIPDSDRPADLVARLRDALAPGSYIAITHVSMEDAAPDTAQQVAAGAAAYRDTLDPVSLRTRAQFAEFFAGFDVVEPGISYASDWHRTAPVDTTDPARPCNFAAVGRVS